MAVVFFCASALAAGACSHTPTQRSVAARVRHSIQRGDLRLAALAMTQAPAPPSPELAAEVAGATLVSFLSHEQAHVRLKVARSLKLAERAAPPGVLQLALTDSLPEVRREGLSCIRRGGRLPNQRLLVAELALRDSSPVVRAEAVRTLAAFDSDERGLQLIGWLTLDSDPAVAVAAAIALHDMGRGESLTALTRKLQASVEAGGVVHPAAGYVARYAGLSEGHGLVLSDSVIRWLAESQLPEDRASVVSLLASRGRSPQILARLCSDPDPWVRGAAAAAVVREAPAGWRAVAERGLADSRAVVQLAVIRALDRRGSFEALTLLRGCARSGQVVAACGALARHGDAAGAWRLLQLAETSKRDRVRLLVAMVYGGVPTAAEDLRAMLDDPSAQIREAVAWGLVRLRPDEALTDLARALADRDQGVRLAAAGAALALTGEEHMGHQLRH